MLVKLKVHFQYYFRSLVDLESLKVLREIMKGLIKGKIGQYRAGYKRLKTDDFSLVGIGIFFDY